VTSPRCVIPKFLDLTGSLTKPQRLAIFLDRPGFPWKKLILGFSIGQYLFEGFLSLRQYQVLKQKKPPKTLENEITQEVFDKSQVCFYPTGRSHVSTDY
jgi:hypothetical protein